MIHENRIQINSNWLFHFEDDAASAVAESVTLPHTWNGLDTMEPDRAANSAAKLAAKLAHYRRGTGWYEREIGASTKSRRRFIHFEAAAMTAQVWFNDALVGNHIGGYTAFDVALPPTSGQLRVSVNNSPDPNLIPSDMSDFFLYGGLTRNVWLYETGAVRLLKLHVVTEWVGKRPFSPCTANVTIWWMGRCWLCN